jgi:hypothetical protein
MPYPTASTLCSAAAPHNNAAGERSEPAALVSPPRPQQRLLGRIAQEVIGHPNESIEILTGERLLNRV